jgi:hypothetical protein
MRELVLHHISSLAWDQQKQRYHSTAHEGHACMETQRNLHAAICFAILCLAKIVPVSKALRNGCKPHRATARPHFRLSTSSPIIDATASDIGRLLASIFSWRSQKLFLEKALKALTTATQRPPTATDRMHTDSGYYARRSEPSTPFLDLTGTLSRICVRREVSSDGDRNRSGGRSKSRTNYTRWKKFRVTATLGLWVSRKERGKIYRGQVSYTVNSVFTYLLNALRAA